MWTTVGLILLVFFASSGSAIKCFECLDVRSGNVTVIKKSIGVVGKVFHCDVDRRIVTHAYGIFGQLVECGYCLKSVRVIVPGSVDFTAYTCIAANKKASSERANERLAARLKRIKGSRIEAHYCSTYLCNGPWPAPPIYKPEKGSLWNVDYKREVEYPWRKLQGNYNISTTTTHMSFSLHFGLGIAILAAFILFSTILGCICDYKKWSVVVASCINRRR